MKYNIQRLVKHGALHWLCRSSLIGATAVGLVSLVPSAIQAQTVGLSLPITRHVWMGATTTNNFNVSLNVSEATGGVATNIIVTISGTNNNGISGVFARITGLNQIGGIFTNSSAATIVVSVTNATKGVYPITVIASGDASFTTNFTVFVVTQWAATNSGASSPWSVGANWTAGSPSSSEDAFMYRSVVAPWTNVVDGTRSIQSLIYLGDTDDNGLANGLNTVINYGSTLSVLGTNGFVVGRRVNSGVRPYYNFSGDTLVVSNTSANFIVNDGNQNSTRFISVVMSNLNTLTAVVSRFSAADASLLANSADGAQMVNLVLAQTNNITALWADNYNAVDFNNSIQYNRQDQANNGSLAIGLQLGKVNNIKADSIGVGRGQASASGNKGGGTVNSPGSYAIQFTQPYSNSMAPSSTVIFRNTNGGQMTLIACGVDSGDGGGALNRGGIDLRGGLADVWVKEMWLGMNRTNGNTAENNGVFTFDNGTVNVDVIRAGYWKYTNVGKAFGFVSVGGGSNAVMNVYKYIILGQFPTEYQGFDNILTTNVYGQVQVRGGGTLNVNTIICGTNVALANQVLVNGGGNLVLTNTIGDSTNKLTVLNANRSAFTFNLDGSSSTTNIITKTLTFAGTPNVINIATIANITPPQRFTLMSFETAAARPSFTKGSVPLGYNGTVNTTWVDASTPGTVYIDITTGVPKTLIWRGYQNANWDHSSTNWWDPVAQTFTNTFNDGDFVIFDDSAVGSTTISVTESVSPGQSVGTDGIAITNNTLAYVLNNGGGSIGLSSMDKYGTKSLAINCVSTLTMGIHEGFFSDSSTMSSVTVSSGAAASFTGTMNGSLSSSGISTNSGNIIGNVSVGNGGSVYNLNSINGGVSVSANAFLYNQGNMINVVNISTGTNSTFINSGNITGSGLTIGGTYLDYGTGLLTFSNVTTINGNGVFLVGNADGNAQVTVQNLGSSTTAPQRGRVLFSNGSTNYFGVNTDNGHANQLISFSVDFGNNNTLAGGGGVLVITNLGAAPYAAGQTFTLFQNNQFDPNDTSISESGTNTALVIRPTAPAPGLAWDTRTLRTNGVIKVITVGTSLPAYTFSPVITNNLVTILNMTTNSTNSSLITTNFSTNKAIISTLTWPSTNVGWRLQQQIDSLSVGIRSGDSNWSYVYPSWWTNTMYVTNTFNNSQAIFFRLTYP